jgi:hypothetical protein
VAKAPRESPDIAPVELLEFDPADWAMLGDTGEWQARQRWHEAREKWAREHPGSTMLGTALDRIRDLMPPSYLANLEQRRRGR